MFLFSELQSEVKRRATRDQSGTEYDTAVKNIINTSLFRLSREGLWRSLRRTETIPTVTTYDTGSGAVATTTSSTAVTITGATLLTDDVHKDRYIKISGSSKYHKVNTITGETTLTLDSSWSGDTATDGTYEILPQMEYNLPLQAGHKTFLWHNEYGYPFQLGYVTDQEFYSSGINETDKATTTHYRMWGVDSVQKQPLEASAMTMSSSVVSDTAQSVVIYGTVSGYPDVEQVTLTGTSSAVGTKLFTEVEQIVKDSSTTGRVTITANSGNTTVAVLPVGNTTASVMYRKIQLWPLPSTAFNINCQYYKIPYRLINDYDVHELGQDFDEALILLSVAKIKAEDSQDQAVSWYGMYKDELRSLRKTNTDKIDWFPTLNKANQSNNNSLVHSQLSYRQVGSNFGIRTRY